MTTIIMLEIILIITLIMLKLIICNELALDHRRSQCGKNNSLVKNKLSSEKGNVSNRGFYVCMSDPTFV